MFSKARLKVALVKDIKTDKGFHEYIGQKKERKHSPSNPPTNKTGELMTTDMEEAEV